MLAADRPRNWATVATEYPAVSSRLTSMHRVITAFPVLGLPIMSSQLTELPPGISVTQHDTTIRSILYNSLCLSFIIVMC